LAATAQALADASLHDDAYASEQKGVFVGTQFGAHRTLADMDWIILDEGAEGLQPINAPNFSVNIPASQLSVRHKLHAFNITLTSAIVAGIEAVVFGADAIRAGRAQCVLAGATEDVPTEVETLLRAPFVHGGACVVTLESARGARNRGARVYAQIGASECLFVNPLEAVPVTGLRARLERILGRLLPAIHGPLPIAGLTCPFPLNQAVTDIVRTFIQSRGGTPVPARFTGASGAYLAVSLVLQLAGLAVEHGRGLLVATSPHGHVVLLILERAAQ
jgi:hypothetical protein